MGILISSAIACMVLVVTVFIGILAYKIAKEVTNKKDGQQ